MSNTTSGDVKRYSDYITMDLVSACINLAKNNADNMGLSKWKVGSWELMGRIKIVTGDRFELSPSIKDCIVDEFKKYFNGPFVIDPRKHTSREHALFDNLITATRAVMGDTESNGVNHYSDYITVKMVTGSIATANQECLCHDDRGRIAAVDLMGKVAYVIGFAYEPPSYVKDNITTVLNDYFINGRINGRNASEYDSPMYAIHGVITKLTQTAVVAPNRTNNIDTAKADAVPPASVKRKPYFNAPDCEKQKSGTNSKQQSTSDIVKRSCLLHRFAGEEIRGHRMTIAEHHYEVAMYAMEITNAVYPDGISVDDDLMTRVLHYALTHDLPEVFTNDISSVVKYSIPGLKATMDKAEEQIVDTFMPPVVQSGFSHGKSVIVSLIVKTADVLAVTRELIDEQKRGNHIANSNYIHEVLERLEQKANSAIMDKEEAKRVFSVCKEIIVNFSMNYSMN